MENRRRNDDSWIKHNRNIESSSTEGKVPRDWQCGECGTLCEADKRHCKDCRQPRKKTTDPKFSGSASHEISTKSDFISARKEKVGTRQSGQHGSEHLGWTPERGNFSHEESTAKCREEQRDSQFQHLYQDNQPDDFMFDGISHNERRIVLIGKTGSGKSATGNTILGIRDTFKSKLSGKSVTKYCQRHEVERFGKKLMVVDTPGLFDTSMPNEHIKEEIGKCIGITCPGPHAIILVVQINRFTEEEQKTVDLFVERFGEGIYRHLIVLFTRKDDLVRMNMSITTYVKDTEQLDNILQRCQDQYIAFDNFSPEEDKDKDVQSLLDMIEVIVQRNGGKPYTNNMFNEAEKALKRRMAAIREEERKKKEKELKDHTDKVAKKYETEINTQKHGKAKQQKEIERLESIRQTELKKQRQQEEENRRLKNEKGKIEKERQRDARDFEVTRKKLEQSQIEKAEREKREKEEQEKQTRDRKELEKLQKQIEAHERHLREATEKKKQLEIEMQKEQKRNIAEILKRYEPKLKEEELRKTVRNEVEERGFLEKVWDVIAFKWLR